LKQTKPRERKQSGGVGTNHKSDGIQLSIFPEYISLFEQCFNLWRTLVETSFSGNGN